METEEVIVTTDLGQGHHLRESLGQGHITDIQGRGPERGKSKCLGVDIQSIDQGPDQDQKVDLGKDQGQKVDLGIDQDQGHQTKQGKGQKINIDPIEGHIQKRETDIKGKHVQGQLILIIGVVVLTERNRLKNQRKTENTRNIGKLT